MAVGGLHVPLVVVPGPSREILLLAEAFDERQAAHVLPVGKVNADALADLIETLLDSCARTGAATGRARDLVTGGGGVAAAARLVLDVGARRKAAVAGSS